MAPRVSVVMTVYNEERYAPGAVQSVLAQNFRDFELLIVDDGSTDATASVLASIADERLRVLRNDANLGQVPSLNRALREARGELVARLDADDRAVPPRLARQVAVLDAEPRVAVVGSFMHVIDESGRRLRTLERRCDGYAQFVFLALRDRLPLFHSCVTFRREPVLALGGYDESLALAEDTDLWRRLALERHDARVVPEPLVVYRHHGGQQSLAGREQQCAHNVRSYERFVEELAEAVPTRLLRLALTADAALWDEVRTRDDACGLRDALDALLAGTRVRLALTAAEDAELRRLVAEHVGEVVRRSWRLGPRAFWRLSPPLHEFARRGGRGRTLRYRVLVAAAPALRLLLSLKRHVLGPRPQTR